MSIRSLDRKFGKVVARCLPKVPRSIMQQWLMSPTELEQFLKKSFKPSFPICFTVKLDVGPRTAEEFKRELNRHNIGFAGLAEDVLYWSSFCAPRQENEVDLVIVSSSDLGFETEVSRAQILRRARMFGLFPCYPEVPFHLCFQQRNTLESLDVAVIMNLYSRDVLGIQATKNTLTLGQYVDYYNQHQGETFWLTGNRFLFIRPRNSSFH